MKITSKLPILALTMFASTSAGLSQTVPRGLKDIPKDTFEYVSVGSTKTLLPSQHGVIPEGGTVDPNIFLLAPSPKVVIKGKEHTAVMSINIKENLLFKYDENGNVERAYSVATGKKSTPTHPKIAIVTHIETYPYKSASRNTKRRQTPGAFGPFCICLNKIDPKTGTQSSTGEFIHGTNVPTSVGKKLSHGCMRMHKKDIETVKNQVKRNDIVLIVSGD